MTAVPAFDVAVIGAGVVGCAIARAFALGGVRVVVLERGADILSGASKGNSAILHTGFDAPPGSLEAACVQAGYADYLAIRDGLNLPVLETDAFVVAWTEEEAAKLPAILAKAHQNGVTGVAAISAAELAKAEPNLASAAAGLFVPGEHVIDPWSAPLAYLLQAIAHGTEIRRRCAVTGGAFDGTIWRLDTSTGQVSARIVINAAGLFGDLVEAIARASPFDIRPRKGQFVVFDKSAHHLIRSIILPVPTERTKGVVLCRTIFGNLLVGPTAEETPEREHATTDEAALRSLIAAGHARIPALGEHAVTAVYAGLRPASERPDYRIEALADRHWISVAGIRSTGLTGALGIARHVAGLYTASFGPLRTDVQPIATPVPNLAEHRPRAIDGAMPGEVVCHCELVTRGEIEAALSGPLPAGDLGGLKRRTRCMMGRCQSFYCAARVASLAPTLTDAQPLGDAA